VLEQGCSQRTSSNRWTGSTRERECGATSLSERREAAGGHPAALTQFFKTPDFWEDAVLLLEAVE
jgi:hypothetical protein